MTHHLPAWHQRRGNTGNLALKLAGSLFAMITLPLIAYFIVLHRTTERAILTSTSRHSLELLRNQRDYLALQLDQIHALATNLGQIEEINLALAEYNHFSRVPAYSSLATNSRISQLLSSYRNFGSLVAIDVFSLDGTCFHVGDSSAQAVDRNALRQRLWDHTILSPAALTWHGVEDNVQRDSGSPKVILATRILWDPKPSWLKPEPVGMLMISYSANYFFEHFSQVDLGKGAYLLVLDDRKRLIYHPNRERIGTTLSAEFAGLLQGTSGSFLQRIGREEVLLSYEHIQDKNWYIVSIVPRETLLATMGNIRFVGWMMLGASLVLIFLGVRLFMQKVVAPIGAIADGFREFQFGRIAPGWRMKESGMRQVADLVRWFNTFLEGDENRRKAEEEIRTLNADLERRVESRTLDLGMANVQLKKATEMAEEANRTKSQFLANMSHELRTPLNAILGFSQIMRRNPELGEKDRNFLERILRSGEHLLGLINEVLSISKIESGTISLNLGPFRMRKLVQEIQDMIAFRAGEKGLELQVQVALDSGDAFLGDERKLRQVLINLLGNAVKFTEIGSVGLKVERVGPKIHFEVRDTGPGLRPEELAKLFAAFQQAEAGRKALEGTGLGLYISQAMVRLMGGEITIQSTLGEGSTFQFEIPLEPLESAEPGPDEGQMVRGLAEEFVGLKSLVVDDRADNRDLLAELLGQWGFEVRTAENGEAALEIWETWEPRVVWMDLIMPGMGGSEAVTRIRAQEAELGRNRALVIALSASVFDADRGALQDQGFDEFVLKPFRESEIREPLERLGGLRFATTDHRQSNPRPNLSAMGLQSLPTDWRVSFRNALLLGDLDQALLLVAELETDPLAEDLRAMVRDYRSEELLHLMEE